MGGICRAEGVALPDMGAGLVQQVQDEIGDVALGNVVTGGRQEDSPEDRLAGLARGRRRKAAGGRLGLPEVFTPSGLTEVDEGVVEV